MICCPICKISNIKRNGKDTKTVFTKNGKKEYYIQKYLCKNMHVFRQKNAPYSYTDSFIEYVVYVYLRCLSLNTTVDIIRATYEEEILTKRQILDFIVLVGKALPTIDEVDNLLTPIRSGYIALDGVWFSYNDKEIVLLVCFDPVSFDIISARFEEDETREGYTKLLTEVIKKISPIEMKGAYGDGDNGLILSLKTLLPHVPFQLCVVHKEIRMGQLVPVKRVHNSRHFTQEQKEEIKTFQKLYRQVIYASSKKESIAARDVLGDFAKKRKQERYMKAYRSLVRNFDYTLTHFEHPGMHRDNNILECFNGILKPRLNLMKSFKKEENLDYYLKLFLLEFRFRSLKESRFEDRRGYSPLQLGDVYLPKYYNFLHFLRKQFKLSFQPNLSQLATF